MFEIVVSPYWLKEFLDKFEEMSEKIEKRKIADKIHDDNLEYEPMSNPRW